MDLESLKMKVEGLISPLINGMGMEIDHIEIARTRGKVLLRIFIDKEGGVTLDDCEKASREIEALLDVEDPIACSYTLEVSSPGLDRPLRKVEDFKKYTGRIARVITHNPIEKETFFIGEIIEAGDTDIVLLLQKDRTVSIPYREISRARLEVIF